MTCNLPRLALDSKSKEEFLEKVSSIFDITAKINNAKRNLIKKRIESGAAPLYSHGFMDLSKQYSTMGITGMYEALDILGFNILTEEGQNFAVEMLNMLNEKINLANKKFKSPHNLEKISKLNTLNLNIAK